MEAKQSPFMPPSCPEAHATPRHESDDSAPCNPPSTHQHPLTPATAPPAVPCSEYTRTHETKQEKRKKGLKVPKHGGSKEPPERSRKYSKEALFKWEL